MHIRYKQGTILSNDITRYELLISTLELELVKTNNILNILNTNLVTIAGMHPGTVILPDTTIVRRALPVNNEAATTISYISKMANYSATATTRLTHRPPNQQLRLRSTIFVKTWV